MENIKVGIIGLTPLNHKKFLPGEYLKEIVLSKPQKILEKKLEALDKESDLIILMSYARLGKNSYDYNIEDGGDLLSLYQNFPIPDLLIGGEDVSSKIIDIDNKSSYVRLGEDGNYVGFFKYTLLKKENEKAVILSIDKKIVPVKTFRDDPDIKKIVSAYVNFTDRVKKEPQLTLKNELDMSLCQIEECFADIAIHKSLMATAKMKGIPADISISRIHMSNLKRKKGESISINDVKKIYPYNDFPTLIYIKGKLLHDYMERSFSIKDEKSRLSISPLKYKIINGAVEISDKMFNEQKTYTAVINSHELYTFYSLFRKEIEKSDFKLLTVLPVLTRSEFLKALSEKLPSHRRAKWKKEKHVVK